MDRHKMLKTLNEYKKIALQLQRPKRKSRGMIRIYRKLNFINPEDESFIQGDFTNRKYIQLKRKAN